MEKREKLRKMLQPRCERKEENWKDREKGERRREGCTRPSVREKHILVGEEERICLPSILIEKEKERQRNENPPHPYKITSYPPFGNRMAKIRETKGKSDTKKATERGKSLLRRIVGEMQPNTIPEAPSTFSDPRSLLFTQCKAETGKKGKAHFGPA